MKVNPTLLLAGACIFIVSILWLSFKNHSLSHQLGATMKDLKKADKSYTKKLDSLNSLKIVLTKELAAVVKSDSINRVALRKAETKTAIAVQKYEDLKKSAPVRYSDIQLDSIIQSITGFTR